MMHVSRVANETTNAFSSFFARLQIMLSLRRLTLLLTAVASLSRTLAEDGAYYSDDDNANNNNNNNAADDDGNAAAGNDDGMQSYNYAYQNDGQSSGDDYIKYWTEYAILPKRCIV